MFPLGERHLKDIDEPERVYELEIKGAEPPSPPDGGPFRPAAAPAQTSERFSPSERKRQEKKRQEKQWEEDQERRIEDYVLSVLDQSFGELGRSKPPGEAERSDAGGLDDIATRADELAKRIELEIRQAWRDPTDTGAG